MTMPFDVYKMRIDQAVQLYASNGGVTFGRTSLSEKQLVLALETIYMDMAA